MEKLTALVSRQVKITMVDGSTPTGELTDVKTRGLVIKDGDDGEFMLPFAIELDRSFEHPLASVSRIELAAASSLPVPRVTRSEPARPKPKPVEPIKVHKFREG
jgi:hypothetical protein